MKKVIVSVINDLSTDQRVNKVCSSLTAMGFDVLLVGRILAASLPLDERPYAMHRMKLLFVKGPCFYAEFNIRLFFFLIIRRFDLLVSNDLDTLLANFLVSKIRRRAIVYDTHEYFTHTPEVIHRPIVQKSWERIERWIFPRLKNIFTVNESIANIYYQKYGIKPLVIRNVPKKMELSSNPGRKELNLPENKRLIILQGAGINIQRGAEELLQAMAFTSDVVLIIAGSGDIIEELKSMAQQPELKDKILFFPKMPYQRLMQYTANADLGLSLDKDTNPNYRFSLPNKIFDYIHAGIPVLVSDLPEISQLVKTWKVGEIIPSHQPEIIAQSIMNMLDHEDKLSTYKNNCRIAAPQLCWENESVLLKKVYAQFL
ncbi:MAG: glycosyltransferase [Bacteroidales bacterium]|nr:glycosyltransferase [Bacteroidales bacterium]